MTLEVWSISPCHRITSPPTTDFSITDLETKMKSKTSSSLLSLYYYMTAYYKKQSFFSQLNKNSKTKIKHSRPYSGQLWSVLSWCQVSSQSRIILQRRRLYPSSPKSKAFVVPHKIMLSKDSQGSFMRHFLTVKSGQQHKQFKTYWLWKTWPPQNGI